MVSKKYTQDFVVEYDKTPRGRLKARAVYKGKLYTFSDTEEKIRITAKCFAVLSATAWIVFLVPLFLLSAAARTSYVIIPHVCVFLPLLGMSAVTVDLWTVKPPLYREKSDHISQRTPKSALFMMLFSGAAALGLVIKLFLNPYIVMPGDLIFALCEAILLTASCLLFKSRGRTRTQEME